MNKETFPGSEELFTAIETIISQMDSGKMQLSDKSSSDLAIAKQLSNNIVNNDYFYKSSKILTDVLFNNSDATIDDWNSQYKKDLKIKQHDVKELFKLISVNIEEWC